MNATLEIFSQGEEIVSGQIVDSNAAWLSEQAVLMGFTVTRHTAVGDKLDDLVQLLKEIAYRSDCCICSGGLGPTSDDLTAEAVSTAFNLPLEFDSVAYAQIEQFFVSRQRQMPESNRKQAMLPKGSLRLDNHVGTAPGFALQYNKCWFAFVPGVPSEMRHLFQEHIQPLLQQHFTLQPSKLVTIRTVGIGESDIQERISKIPVPPKVQLGYRAELGQVQTKLLFPDDYPPDERLNLVQAMANALGDAVYAIDETAQQQSDLYSVIDRQMAEKNLTLSIVETMSYGALAAKLTGAEWLISAAFEQSLATFLQRLGIQTQSDAILTNMKTLAESIKLNTGADLVLIQSMRDGNLFHANPTDPRMLINLLLTEQGEYKSTVRRLVGDVFRKQQQAALYPLDLLRRYLQGKDIE